MGSFSDILGRGTKVVVDGQKPFTVFVPAGVCDIGEIVNRFSGVNPADIARQVN